MDEAFVLACKKLVVMGDAAGFTVDDILERLLNGITVEQLLAIIEGRLMGMAEPGASKWVM